jgi:ATP-binding cassette, subfamily B, bacterial
VARFERNARRYRDASVKQGDIEARFLPLLLLCGAGGRPAARAAALPPGVLDVGQVVAYFGILLMLDFPTWTSMWAYSQISLGLAGARRILELMNRETTWIRTPAVTAARCAARSSSAM